MTEEPKRKNGIETLRLMAMLAFAGSLPSETYELERTPQTRRIHVHRREKKSEAVRWVNGRMVRKDGAE